MSTLHVHELQIQEPYILAPYTLASHILLLVNQARDIRRAKAVINIHNAYIAGAGVQHAEESGQAFEGGAVTDAGGNGDYGDSDEASDYAG